MGVDATMAVRMNKGMELTESAVRYLSARLTDAFMFDTFWLVKPKELCAEGDCCSVSADYPARHALSILSQEKLEEARREGWADQFPDSGATDAQIIRVHLSGRYYGPDYERGDLVSILAVVEWLQYNITDGDVWYGGDSGGKQTLMTEKAKQELWRHFCKVGHRPYYHKKHHEQDGMMCSFCNVQLSHYGVGGARGFYCCGSCGTNFIRDNSCKPATYKVVKDFFAGVKIDEHSLRAYNSKGRAGLGDGASLIL